MDVFYVLSEHASAAARARCRRNDSVRNVWRPPLRPEISHHLRPFRICYVLYHLSDCCARNACVRVTFGAPHFGFPVAMWRRRAVDHIGGVSHGSGFPQLRSDFVLGRHRVACFFVARHCPCECTVIVFEIVWRAKLALPKRNVDVVVGNAFRRLFFPSSFIQRWWFHSQRGCISRKHC